MRKKYRVKDLEGVYRHHSLSEEQISKITKIKSALDEVYSQSLDEWVDGFRQDTHPDQEIAIWQRIAKTYSKYADQYPTDPSRRKEIFTILLECAVEEQKDILRNLRLQYLSRAEARKIISEFFQEGPVPTITVEKEDPKGGIGIA